MLKLSDLITTVALAIHGSSRELRSSVLHTLRSLESTRLKELKTWNEQNVTACTPLVRAFGKTLEDAQIEAEVIEATAAPQLEGTSQSRRR
jgi:hypothetical protein